MFSRIQIKQSKRQPEGFTLIELLFVVTIFGFIASIAVPGLRQARQYANSGSAIQSLRTITSCQYMYETTHLKYGTLNALFTDALINADLGDGDKSGYTFTILVGPTSRTFTCTATPENDSGLLAHYFVDETGVIRYNTGAPADGTSEPIPR